MDLAKLIVKSKTVDFEYPGCPGLEVSIAYQTREELRDMRERCVTQKFSKKTHLPEDEVDMDVFQELYVGAVIKGWKGFKYSYLAKMIPLDVESIPAPEWKDGEGIFPYSKEAAEIIMKNGVDFDNWITRKLEDVENFTKRS